MVTITGDVATTITAVGGLITIIGNFILALLQLRKSKENNTAIKENTQVTKDSAKKIDDVHAVTDVIKSASGRINVETLRAEHEQGVREGVAAAVAVRAPNESG